VAVYRAQETDREDAVFRDPFARALAGERGAQIAASLPLADEQAWSVVARTHVVDRFVTRLVNHGVDLVVNLAAGLDTRPYRMALPASLRWVEVDLPEILDYKEAILGAAAPVCAVERVRLDLSNEDARRGLFARLGRGAERVAILAEGLAIYLMPHEVASLARDLATPPSFQYWVVDLVSPGLLEMMKERGGEMVREAGAPLLFAPPEGPPFFTPHGWTPMEVKSLLKAGAKIGRLPLTMRMFAALPDSSGAQGSRPWSAVCLLGRG
jgi:methyltransferase (TIGR00027 family)